MPREAPGLRLERAAPNVHTAAHGTWPLRAPGCATLRTRVGGSPGSGSFCSQLETGSASPSPLLNAAHSWRSAKQRQRGRGKATWLQARSQLGRPWVWTDSAGTRGQERLPGAGSTAIPSFIRLFAVLGAGMKG